MKLVRYVVSFVILYFAVLFIAFYFNIGELRANLVGDEVTSYLVFNDVEASADTVEETVITETVTETVPEPVESEEERIYFKFKVNVNAGYCLNIRKEPSMDAEIIGYLYKDEVGIILDRDDDWVHINFTRDETLYDGYVSMKYIYILDPNTGEILSD